MQDAQRQVERINASMKQMLDSTKDEIKVLATKMEQDSQAAAAEAEKAWLKRQAGKQAAARRRAAAGKPGAAVPDPGGVDIAPGDLPAPSAGRGRPSRSHAPSSGSRTCTRAPVRMSGIARVSR